MTLANPFGPVVRAWDRVAETMEQAAANYRDGEVVGFENVTTFVTDDVAYIVEVERFKTKLGGAMISSQWHCGPQASFGVKTTAGRSRIVMRIR